MTGGYAAEFAQLRSALSRTQPRLDDTSLDIVLSALTETNESTTTEDCLAWLKHHATKTTFVVRQVPLLELRRWRFDSGRNLQHETGRFFAIEGIGVTTNRGRVPTWSQPIIVQPEIGILGILCQKRHGLLNFLMQAKCEPGNRNIAQLSPTVQATRSNYMRVHGGEAPPYLEYFQRLDLAKIIVDQLQSEQGARFFKKRNRNMVIEVEPGHDVHLTDRYCWLTLGQIKRLMQHDSIVNMDSRTVLSCLQLNFA